ncbi:MAG TPA: hypothetical protein VNG51_28845 [Ktedonobacteraceae bacterium]|nr:hypothetical protein [Ktedonobacteraceae bacterium]
MAATRDIYDVTDDLFKVFKTIRVMFRHWTNESPDAFMQEMMKFRALETELEQVTGDEGSAHTLILGIYRSVFPQAHPYQRTGV